ncbi:MAG: hypothetical protein PHS41_04760 [Victivallaceae bacterium]|nr:hypothetical protein [Victivallaceae bacterium]
MGQQGEPKKKSSGRKKSSGDEKPEKVSTEALLERIVELEKAMDQDRRRQSLVTWGGLVVVLVVLVLFLGNLIRLARDFDRQALAADMLQQTAVLMRGPEFQEIQKDFIEVFVPAYRDAFTANVLARRGEFEKVGQAEWQRTVEFLRKDIVKKAVARLHASMDRVGRKLVAKHGGSLPAPEDLEKNLKKLEDLLVENVTTVLEQELAEAEKSLASLNRNIQAFKLLPEYKKLSEIPVEELENRLIETFLEIWIYQLNPARDTVRDAVADNGGF